MTTESFDVIVIGSGPGGYVAAIRAAQLGLKTACVEQEQNAEQGPAFGGTCLNVGCIPSKALLQSSEHYHAIQHDMAAHGITVDNASINIAEMQSRKAGIVKQMTGGIGMLFKGNKVETLFGHGKITAANTVTVTAKDQSQKNYSAKHIIIATGSSPVDIPIAKADHNHIVDSTGALEFTETPKTLGVIGAGVIGLELGSVWARLGTRVTLLEAMPEFLATADKNISREASKQFKAQGLDIQLNARVTNAVVQDNQVHVTYESEGQSQLLVVDKLLVSVGRRPNSRNISSESLGLALDERGFVNVDNYCKTNVPNIWAIGDVVRGPMLAHKASEEGIAVAERIAGNIGHIDFNTVPWVIYTQPEIAWVGKTEAQLKAENIEYNAGMFPFAAVGRAKALGQDSGFVKILADKQTDRILGAHIIGPMASELIQECVFAMEMQASAADLALTIHGHPTLSEAIHEAALGVHGKAIHKINRK
jgi:dihydrolipoamide dehydrogenase